MQEIARMLGRVVGQLARLAALLLAPLVAMPVPAAETGDFRILYFEPLSPLPGDQFAFAQLKATDEPLVSAFSFDAYGRRFELALERNTRVMQDPAASAVAYRGILVQQPGSWTRLTRIGEQLYGMVWDGADLYVIEPAGAARDFMVAPLDPALDGNVIYRLSDTLIDLGPGFCSAIDSTPEDPATDGLSTFKALTGDLKNHTILQQAPGAILALRLSALGDEQFRQRYATAAEASDAILVRLNNVDGIYSAQLGVEVQVNDVLVYEAATGPFTMTTSAGTLLNELGGLRNNTPTLNDDGLTHLFTGRNLDGNTVGIAYIDALCRNRYGAGLTESRGGGATIESLIAAHEIGHNFGAEHDGNGQCASTPTDRFIMAPELMPGIDTFSACSLSAMSRSIDRASCINTLPPADVSATVTTAPAGLKSGQTFDWSVTVTSLGGQQANAAAVDITLPPGITFINATVAGGSCASGAGVTQCTLGSLPVNASRTVALTLRAETSGLFTVTAHAFATNDANAANDSASAVLAVDATAPVIGNPPAPASISAGSSSGGGGGGSMNIAFTLLLTLIALVRLRRRVPAA